MLLLGGFLLVVLGFVANNAVSTYVDRVQGPAVHDLILDHIPMLDLTFLFFWVVLVFWVSMLVYHLFYPRELSFVLWSLGVFIFVRMVFISLTHLGPPENVLTIPEELKYYSFTADLFFSGHVGAPFLLALTVKQKWIKRIAFVYAVSMVFIVLLSHGHYSIDIFASMFIAHSISVILQPASRFFVGYSLGD